MFDIGLCGCDPCRLWLTPVVTDDELSDPRFLRDTKRTLYDMGIRERRWRPTLYEWHRVYVANGGIYLDEDGQKTILNLEAIEVREPRPYEHDADEFPDPFPEWAGDFATIVSPQMAPFLIRESKERARVWLTIVKARFPGIEAFWGCKDSREGNFLL